MVTHRAEQTRLARPSRPPPAELARLPIHFFAAAIAFFAIGVAAAPWAIGWAADYFYQPAALAWVHTFTLGWITSAMMGVMYRYVPGLTKRSLPFPRVALVQLALYLIGVSGMVAHFMLADWVGLWMAAAVVVLSVALFALNILPCLAAQFGRGPAETGMGLAIVFLLATGTLGLLLALDKTHNFMPGSVLTNLAAHAHLAALGWVTVTICAVSYRFLPAFLVSKAELPRATIWQVGGLAAAAAGLGLTLLARAPGAALWSAAVAIAIAGYIAILAHIVRHRAMPVDWTVRHALAGTGWLVAAAMVGIALARTGADSALGNRLAGAYGALGVLGWVSNFIVGMSYQLFPGFVVRVRAVFGWPPLTIAELSLSAGRPLVFICLNAGVLALAGGLLAGQLEMARAGASLLAIGGLAYVSATGWTLSYAYRRSVPPPSRAALRILPG